MSLLKRLTPFLLAGVVLAVLAFGLILLAYLFVIGSLIGMILFIFNWVRERFFTPVKTSQPKPSGRVIDTDDWRKL